MRPAVLAALAWAVGAATAVTVGLVALSSVGTSVANGPADPLAHAAADLASAPGAGATANPTATATPGPATATATATTGAATSGVSTERQLTSAGGSVIARCTDGLAYLVIWSPAPGFHASDVARGPATKVKVEFEGGSQEVPLVVTCVNGAPQSVPGSAHDDSSPSG